MPLLDLKCLFFMLKPSLSLYERPSLPFCLRFCPQNFVFKFKGFEACSTRIRKTARHFRSLHFPNARRPASSSVISPPGLSLLSLLKSFAARSKSPVLLKSFAARCKSSSVRLKSSLPGSADAPPFQMLLLRITVTAFPISSPVLTLPKIRLSTPLSGCRREEKYFVLPDCDGNEIPSSHASVVTP